MKPNSENYGLCVWQPGAAVTVLLDALFGPDIRTTSAGGDSSVIPSAIVIAILAFFATWVVAKHGFRHERAN